MRWRLWWRRADDEGEARRVQETKLRRAERETPLYERLADRVADLPADEFAARVARAFQQRPRPVS